MLDLGQQIHGAVAGFAGAAAAVHAPSLGDLGAGGHRPGSAEYFGSCRIRPARLPRMARMAVLVGLEDVDAVEAELVGRDAGGARQQAQDRARGERLAGAGFADDAELFGADRRGARRARRG
jgi:hypothetical protein